MHAIEVKDLTFAYAQENVVNNVSFTVEPGQIVAIQGENGSGKSTLLKLILGQLPADNGSIAINEVDIKKVKDFRCIGYVPQVQNFSDIGFPITTREIVVLNLYKDFGFVKIPKKEHYAKAEEILKSLGLSKYIKTPYNQLSGGFKQRTMIARALINDPEILVLDEPTAGVDIESKESFLELINETSRKKNYTVVIVTHEMELIEKHLTLDATYKMEGGELVKC